MKAVPVKTSRTRLPRAYILEKEDGRLRSVNETSRRVFCYEASRGPLQTKAPNAIQSRFRQGIYSQSSTPSVSISLVIIRAARRLAIKLFNFINLTNSTNLFDLYESLSPLWPSTDHRFYSITKPRVLFTLESMVRISVYRVKRNWNLFIFILFHLEKPNSHQVVVESKTCVGCGAILSHVLMSSRRIWRRIFDAGFNCRFNTVSNASTYTSGRGIQQVRPQRRPQKVHKFFLFILNLVGY